MLTEQLLSTRAIARRLTEEGIPTSRGAVQWQPTAVFRMLTTPVYKGSYRYRQSGQEEILIPVTALVDEATWQAAQAQLLANSQYSKRNNGRQQYLLRGLVLLCQLAMKYRIANLRMGNAKHSRVRLPSYRTALNPW